MKPELIVMLTHNDKTVQNAIELFDTLKDSPVQHWGFKDVGLGRDEMERLVRLMKSAGKTTYLEVVSLSEDEGLSGADLALSCGFDILMGTVFFGSIHALLKNSPVKYYPFIGHVHDHPSILDGKIEDVAKEAESLEAKGVDGIDLLSYRYTGDAPKLLKAVVQATKKMPVVSAGSIYTYQRIAEVRDTGAWGFTIGTAFFEKKFVPDGSFRDNMLAVWKWVQEHGRH
jgi:2,4-dienoyl-CoA reductase-like NADH-dependent reductase (Old Yellow Enzyme family)